MNLNIVAVTALVVMVVFGGSNISVAEVIPPSAQSSSIDGHRSFHVPEYCKAKFVISESAFQLRDTVSVEKIMDVVHDSWENELKGIISRATYVDMQRIVRDVYRKTSLDQWNVESSESIEFGKREIEHCMVNSF